MKKILLLILLTVTIRTMSSLETLPQMSFLGSGFNGRDYSMIENTKFRIFDLSDNTNTVNMNGDNYLSSKFVQYTSIEKRVENSTQAICTQYNEFFHKITQEYHVSAGVPIDSVYVGMKYSKEMEKLLHSIDSEKKVAGLSTDERLMYSLTLGPAFIIP
jgi:hypothetical protein